jgi:hypothetical protein
VAQRDHVEAEPLDLGLDAAGAGGDHLTGRSEVPAPPVDQLCPELSLEVGHVHRDVRLHGVERTGGGREAAGLCDGQERVELSQVHDGLTGRLGWGSVSPRTPSGKTIETISDNCWTDRLGPGILFA